MNTASSRDTLGAVLQALRLSQWTKNAVVFAAFFFALGDQTRSGPLDAGALQRVVGAALLFCLVSSGIYVFNDILDAPADRRHPEKRYRPIAAGRIGPGAAWVLSLLLLATGVTGAFGLSPAFASVVLLYVILQILYTLALKHIALVDVFLIATGFVLRAVAGAVVLRVRISPWLLLCAFLLALFLALCKRRHEKVLLANGEDHRASLGQYSRHLLDLLLAIVSAATIVCYAIYTLWPETVHKFDTSSLAFTIPLVMFGIFRYLDLVYRHHEGGRPEKVLLSDMPLLANLVLYGAVVLAIFYFHL